MILGGAEHGPVLMKFIKARINVDVRYMYDDFQGIKRHAAGKVSKTLESVKSINDLQGDEETDNLLDGLHSTLQALNGDH